MKLGTIAPHPDWLTMLPGCLLAGMGLGVTNTPVTNTTTGSVSSDRAGMASGIDMSARLISLAVNIALMGLILMSGVLVYLKQSMPNLYATDLRSLAERIAAGSQTATPGLSRDTAYFALRNGFGWVMVYGAISAWTLAVVSALTFNFRNSTNVKKAT